MRILSHMDRKKDSLLKKLVNGAIWVLAMGLGVAVLLNYLNNRSLEEKVPDYSTSSLVNQDQHQDLLNRAYDLMKTEGLQLWEGSYSSTSSYNEKLDQLLQAIVYHNQDSATLERAINEFTNLYSEESVDESIDFESPYAYWVSYTTNKVDMTGKIIAGKGSWIDFRKTQDVSDQSVYELYALLEELPDALIRPVLRADVVGGDELEIPGEGLSFKVAGRAVNPMMAITQDYVNNKYLVYHELGHIIDSAFHTGTVSIYDTRNLSNEENWILIAEEEWPNEGHYSSSVESFAAGFAIYLLQKVDKASASDYGYPESQSKRNKPKTFAYFEQLFSEKGLTF